MQSRALGTTGIRVSEITLGTWGLASGAYGEVAPSRYEATVKAAWDAGVTTFDVSPMWGDGASLWRTSAALGDHVNDAVFISRCGFAKVEATWMGRFETQPILDDVDDQLRKLGRDQLDVLLLHNPPAKVLSSSETFLKGMTHLVETGKLRAWGASVGGTEEARLALKAGASVVGLAHNLLWPEDLRDLETALDARPAGVVVRSPLAYGLLSDRFMTGHEFARDDHRSRRWDAGAFGERVRQTQELRFLVKGEVRDLASAALRYCLHDKRVSTVAVGARTREQIEHAAAAIPAEPPYLPDEDLGRLSTLRVA